MPKHHRRGRKGEDAEEQRAAASSRRGRPAHERELLDTLLAVPLAPCPRCDAAGTVPSRAAKSGRAKCPTCHGSGRIADPGWEEMLDRVMADGLSLRAQMALATATIVAIQRDVADEMMLPERGHRLSLTAQDTLRRLTELELNHEVEVAPEAVRVTIDYTDDGDPGGDQLTVDASDRAAKAD